MKFAKFTIYLKKDTQTKKWGGVGCHIAVNSQTMFAGNSLSKGWRFIFYSSYCFFSHFYSKRMHVMRDIKKRKYETSGFYVTPFILNIYLSHSLFQPQPEENNNRLMKTQIGFWMPIRFLFIITFNIHPLFCFHCRCLF